jgi:type II secretory pathway pseudopilin PulG
MKSLAGSSPSGFTMIEALIGVVLTGIILVATLTVIRPTADLSRMVGERGELQQNARVAINAVARELKIAGTGTPREGVQLPAGENALPPLFACDFAGCYLDNGFYDDHYLYSITPGDTKGPQVSGVVTDSVTVLYRDPSYSLDQFPLVQILTGGTEIRVDPATQPAIDDPAVGLQAGDVLLLCNVNGCAAAAVTGVSGSQSRVLLAPGDPLHFNQPSAEYGNVRSLANPGVDEEYPPTRAFRVHIVTFFLLNTDPENPRLMRQVNAHPAEPVAEFVESFQLSYDIFDESAEQATAGLAGAGGFPNQIRKSNVSVGTRSPRRRLFGRGFEHSVLLTSVSARNMIFRERYR